ncbi:hypothetical protein [Streptomyces sp. NPDC057287]|uniref:hypothetical protein n=1 Tax=Streptomyces sp. NPDC057287 TaxID=3346086 RepID=UPI003637DBC4
MEHDAQVSGDQMKLTVYQFEGTAAELDASELVRKLTEHRKCLPSGPLTAPAPNETWTSARIPGVAEEGQAAVRAQLARNSTSHVLLQFLRQAAQWDNVGVHGIKRKGAPAGTPLDYSRYLRMRKRGSQFGGFAYLWAESGIVNLRLDHSHEQLAKMGVTRARTLTTGHRAYRVSVDLVDEVSLSDALQLAELAYAAT